MLLLARVSLLVFLKAAASKPPLRSCWIEALADRKQWANELVMTYQQEAEAGHPAGVGMCVCSWCSPWGHLDQQG